MKRLFPLVILGLFLTPFIIKSQTTTPVQSQKKIALVIGNGNYQTSILANPENDARAMKSVLLQSGFEVLEFENLSQIQMKRAIDDFGVRLKEYEVGLFFYAGHGIQSKGINYLIPIDANLITENQVEYDCVQADRILTLMEESGAKVKIIILDACRNNPFERSWTRSTSGKGLASMNAPSGTLIAYATAPGSTASDGSGKNGLYTSAILDNIFTPNITIIQMFQNVRAIVSEKSNKLQIPWESTSLVGDFYFNVSSDFTTPNFSDISYVDKSYLIRSTSLINRAPNDIRIADIARKVKYLKTGINPVAYDTVLYAILNQGLKQRIKRKHYLNVFTNESIDTINNNTKGTKIGHIYISSSWENTAEGKLYFKKPFHYGTDFDLKSVHAEIKNTWVTIFTTFGLEDAGKTIGGGIIVYNRWIGGYVEGKKNNTLYYGLVKTIGYNFAIRVGHGSTLEYDRLNIGDIKMTEIGFISKIRKASILYGFGFGKRVALNSDNRPSLYSNINLNLGLGYSF